MRWETKYITARDDCVTSTLHSDDSVTNTNVTTVWRTQMWRLCDEHKCDDGVTNKYVGHFTAYRIFTYPVLLHNTKCTYAWQFFFGNKKNPR
jgi:hypothetical protein